MEWSLDSTLDDKIIFVTIENIYIINYLGKWMNTISIHGVNIVTESKNSLLLDLEARLQSTQRPLLIFTPNAENLLRADENQYLKQALQIHSEVYMLVQLLVFDFYQ